MIRILIDDGLKITETVKIMVRTKEKKRSYG